MGTSRSKKNPSAEITDRVDRRIVEVAMQNPDLGAGRLAALLERKKTKVSPSKIYRTLKRHGLQTREKRRALLEAQDRASKAPAATPPPEITPEVEELVVETSLQHPDFGARRLLTLLNREGIDMPTSAVYGILRRNGLQNREKRLAAVEARSAGGQDAEPFAEETVPGTDEQAPGVAPVPPQASWDELSESWSFEEEIEYSTADDSSGYDSDGLDTGPAAPGSSHSPPVIESEQPVFEIPPETGTHEALRVGDAPDSGDQDAEKEPERVIVAAPRSRETATGSGALRWLFRFVNLLLLVLAGYLGFVTFQNFRQARAELEAGAAPPPAPAKTVARKKPAATLPLQAYSKIWERNLFNVKTEQAADEQKEVPIEKIAPARKDIGLELVGTVFSSDAALSRAIVYVQKTKKEEAFREGDSTEKARIKKILRNKVIITTAEGDQLLEINPEDYAKRRGGPAPRTAAYLGPRSARRQAGVASSISPAAGRTKRPIRTLSIRLKREQVDASLKDVDELLGELKISPFLQDGQPAGFIVSKIPRRNILTRMGLRNGYAVTHLNDRAVTGPDEAADFFRTLAEGGDVSFQIQRSRGIRSRARKIQLNIE